MRSRFRIYGLLAGIPKRGWLTPDELPESATDFRVIRLPDSQVFQAAVYGALLDLTYAENWEEFGTATPEECADFAHQMIQEFLEEHAMQVGDVWPTERDDTPVYALECDGAVYDIADYPDLAAILGTRYGGNGTTTFGVPDYGDRALTGLGSANQGDLFGAASVSLTAGQNGQHSHTEVTAVPMPTTLGAGVPIVYATAGAGSTGLSGSGSAHENRPPSVAVRYLIKAL